VMGGKQASETLLGIRLHNMERSGAQLGDTEKNALLREIQERYRDETDPLYAASRLWVDGIIDPANTRDVISLGIAMAAHNPDIPRFNPGVLQT